MIETKEKLKIRRAPKFLPFMFTGAILGLILSLILYFAGPAQEGLLGYLVAWVTAIGAALGIVIALLADWLYSRASKEVVATKLEK